MTSHTSLEKKLLADFHGNPLEIDNIFDGIFPVLDTKAQIQIKNALDREDNGCYFRVEIVGGGCAGLQYQFIIDHIPIAFDDLVFWEDPKCVIDVESFKYMQGAIIKWKDDINGSYLYVKNEGAKQTCGCFGSFSYDGY